MIKGLGTTALLAAIAAVLGIGLFFVKHEVKEQEARLAELNRDIQRNQEEIHVLKAEWSYLNDPARLRQLSEKFLSMRVMGPSQITSLAPARKEPTATAALAAPKPAPAPVPQPHKPAPAKAEPAKPAPKPAPAYQPPPPAALAGAPIAQPQPARPAAAPAPERAPGRTIVIQSPALAQTPDQPGGLR